jgi:hypothetical protein
LITARGVKPVGETQWQRGCFWLYGAVEPLTGFSFFYEFSHLDRLCFQQFLALLSLQLGDDIAVMQVDQASAHTANALVCPSNIILTLSAVSYSRTQSIERLWLFLKKQFAWGQLSDPRGIAPTKRSMLSVTE